KTALYTKDTRMCVLSCGSPPFDTSQITFKLLNVQIAPKVTAGARTGLSNGSVTCQNCCQRETRAIRAPSYNSCGIPFIPPSAITIMNENPTQTLATMPASNARSGSPSQFTGGVRCSTPSNQATGGN